MLSIAADYERETGVRVEFDFGDSGAMLGNATVRPDGALFLPADDSYVRLAEERGLVAQTFPLCTMHAVILTQPGNPHGITSFESLLQPGIKLGIANPDRAAIGKVTRDRLRALGKWDAFDARIHVQHTTVTDSANAVQLGTTDAAVVWDVVALNYPELGVVRVPELDGAVGRVELAALKSAPDPAAAKKFARYIAASDRGLSQLRKAGFANLEAGKPWSETGSEP
jgi:molybdate transport system substrate-binding protein